MNLFLAAAYTSNFGKGSTIYAKLDQAERYWRDNHLHILESYHYIKKESYVEKLREDKQKVFLDSGAFSAFTQGVDIDIPDYCNYVRDNWDIIVEDPQNHILLFSVLDKISLTDRKASAEGTKTNQLFMEDYFNKNGARGLRPLPCYHYGEPTEYLEYYVANYPYITIGGMVPISTRDLYKWLDKIWGRYLTNGAGRPRTKVHGFGLTTVSLMERFPWASVDSSSWVQIAVHGNVLIPDNDLMKNIHPPKKKPIKIDVSVDAVNISERDRNLPVSMDSPRKKEDEMHWNTYPLIERKIINKICKSAGFKMKRLRNSAYSRWAFNFWSYNQINLRINKEHGADPRFKPQELDLFNYENIDCGGDVQGLSDIYQSVQTEH